MSTGVLVIGGGTGGTAAGIQSARMGVPTIIAEPSVWLGGMFTAAGVPAFDGNHNMPSGIWGEFRERLYKVYGGADKVATGWVSNTLFEPHVGDSILKSMVSVTPALKVLFRYEFIKTLKDHNSVKGAVFYDKLAKSTVTIYAKQVIDATELGDVLADAGIPFDVGMEANSITGENVNVPESNTIIQDITYAAILKDYGPAADCTLVKPALYDPGEFDCCCNEYCSNPAALASNVTAKKMLDYGRLPNGKYMINWPAKGNDIYLDLINMNSRQREEAMQKAKDKTIRFIYFLQTQFGFKNLGLAKDEFPTADRLPMMPYYREGRRVKGIVRFNFKNIADPFNDQSPLYRTGIAVGDYPVDHHHKENSKAPQHLGFYPVPSFNVPSGALIPEKYAGIIIAEKGISVTNVVNGTTRLQPCVMLTGQAAGALAALCVQQKKNAIDIPVRAVQNQLLVSGAYIMPYYDVKPDHPFFIPIQKIGATGILKGTGQPNAWANRTWFYPDSLVEFKSFINDFKACIAVNYYTNGKYLTIDDLFNIIRLCNPALRKNKMLTSTSFQQSWLDAGLTNFDSKREIMRKEVAVMLEKWISPFENIPVGYNGKFLPVKIK
ncbi:FAD-dependent oxidoreductase [Ferruginibacter profundus]